MPELGVADVPAQACEAGRPLWRPEEARRWALDMAAELVREGALHPLVDPRDGSDPLQGAAALAWYADRLAAFGLEHQQDGVDALRWLCRARSARFAQGAVEMWRLLGDARLLIDYVRDGA